MEYLRIHFCWFEGKTGVEVGFEVSRIHETPANRKSISLHQTGLRACQARQSGYPGFYIAPDGRAAHTSCPFTEDLITELLFMTPDAMGKLLQDYIDDA